MSPSLRKRSSTGASKDEDDGDFDDINVGSSPMIILFDEAEGAPLVQAPSEEDMALMQAISHVSMSNDNPAGLNTFKVYILTLCAILQTIVLLLTMHLFSDRHNKEEMYEMRHVTILADMVKLFVACAMESMTSGGNLGSSFWQFTVLRRRDAMLMLVPTLLYELQDWLTSLAVSNLQPHPFRLVQEFRIIVIALVSTKILKTSYSIKQWICMLLVWAGGFLSTIDHALSKTFWFYEESSNILGYETVILSVVCFAVGGVFFEHVVKLTPEQGDVSASIWMRLIQLSLFSLLIHGIFGGFVSPSESSFFAGFGPLVWILVISQGCLSAILAATIYFTDNVLKCLAIMTGSTVAAVFYAGSWETESSGAMFVAGCILLGTGAWFYCNPLPRACL